jgi:hypothetical protein
MSAERDERPTLGDLLGSGSELRDERGVVEGGVGALDPDVLVAKLASQYGVTFKQLSEELNGNSVSAKILRDLLNLPSPRRPRGRPRKTEETWLEFVLIEMLRRSGSSIGKAVEAVVNCTVADDSEVTAPARIRKRHQRSLEKWGSDAAPRNTAEMFGPIPEQLEDKKKS